MSTMYSQYSYSHNGAGQAATAVAVQQGSMTWNGSEWVSDPNAVAKAAGYAFQQSSFPSNGAQYQFQTSSVPMQPQPQPQPLQGEDPSEQYKRYWRYWSDQAKAQRSKADSLLPCAERDEALRVAAWAEYYASQSDNAARYYQSYSNNQQSQPSQPSQPPASQPLPPPPQPQQTIKKSIPAPAPAPAPREEKQKQQSQDEYPPSFKRYMHKVISKCTTDQQRQLAQAAVEKKVLTAIETNTMFTTEWDTKPLPDIFQKPPFPSSSSLSQNISSSSSSSLSHSQSTAKHQVSFPQKKRSSEELGTQSKTRAKNGKKSLVEEDDYLKKMPANDSYYGRASGQDQDQNKQLLSTNKKQKVQSQASTKNNKTVKKAAVVESRVRSSTGFERSSTALARRADRFSDTLDRMDSRSSDSSDTPDDKVGQYMGMTVINGGQRTRLGESDFEFMTVKGTCQKLEKEYLRLTQQPKPEMIRPLYILEKHLKNLKRKWSHQKCEYSWLCSQLKAIRQDLTVQRIQNDFAVEVYETHARIALEQKDLNEYNQSQTQLKELYDLLEHKYHGSGSRPKGLQNQNEFIAYRIIYYVLLTGNKKYQGGSSDLFKIMLSLTPEQRKDPCVDHSLKVRVAVADNNYYRFFRLQDTCPKMGAYLMDYMVPTLRFAALQRICKVYRPSIPTKFVLSELGFDVNNKNDAKEGLNWMKHCGAEISRDKEQILTKESNIQASIPEAKKNSLI